MANRKATDFIVVHCAATKPTMDIGVAEIRKWHQGQGWADIGYHFVIRRDGTIENGRPMEAVGAHAKGYNSVAVGVCLVGGVDSNMKPDANYTAEQWASLESIVARLSAVYPKAKVLGHTNLDKGKACPCFDVQSWWAKINA